MCDAWMPTIKLALTLEQFRQLPRNPAYKYEYLDGVAYLTPRAKHYHATLDLATPPAIESLPSCASFKLRPLHDQDWPELELVFAGSFRTIQPFGGLDEATMKEATHQCLERTRTGGDGPVIASACFVAEQDKHVIGSVLVTLVPGDDECDSESYRWYEPPPEDCIEKRLGLPHLTWIFVAPMLAGKGVGSALLANAVEELRKLGFTRLLSTFVVGNDSSMLWHWRSGFRLLAHPISYRLMAERREWRKKK
jgi:GNAT superfamily N-acetyltransferase